MMFGREICIAVEYDFLVVDQYNFFFFRERDFFVLVVETVE